jgi:hypothetical protein
MPMMRSTHLAVGWRQGDDALKLGVLELKRRVLNLPSGRENSDGVRLAAIENRTHVYKAVVRSIAGSSDNELSAL